MVARILDGERISKRIKVKVKEEVKKFKEKGGEVSLHSVMVGDNPASSIYVKNQKKNAKEVGISYTLHKLPQEISQKELLSFLQKLNDDRKVNGIILQMPIPSHINSNEVKAKIYSKKDVEGVNPYNMGLLIYGKGKLLPCTAKAVMLLLEETGVKLKGLEVTIIGHSEIIGKPLTLMLLSSQFESPTVTVCHIATCNLSSHTKRADILVSAVGKAGLIRGDMIKEGAIVIDAGISRIRDAQNKTRMVGDVDFSEAVKKASFITPVPGGVGPVTTAVLLENTLKALKIQKGIK